MEGHYHRNEDMTVVIQFKKCNTTLPCLNCSLVSTQLKWIVHEFLSKETMHCVNVIRQISSIFVYLSRSALPGIPDDNGISCSRDRIGRYGRSVSADIPHSSGRLDKLTRKNNKLNIYSVTSTVVPYCKLRGILPRNSTEHKGQIKRGKNAHSGTQYGIRVRSVIGKWFSFYTG